MDYRWAVIGAGKMAGAILSQAVAKGHVTAGEVCVAEADPARLESFRREGYAAMQSNTEAVKRASLILLGVRPGQVAGVLGEIAPFMDCKTLVSIAAGVSVSSLKALLPGSASVVRLMPNLPVVMGCGACVIAAPAEAPPEHLCEICAFLRCGGEVYELQEEQINAVTALSGSGPGYFFRIARVMCQAASDMGIDEKTALALLSQTMLGSAKMLREEGASPALLAREVAVPGGTTQAAFTAFDEFGLDTAIAEGMSMCAKRAGELGN
jgi:pyrroline-5-carboxylate reductase